jgi:hypothetical protein
VLISTKFVGCTLAVLANLALRLKYPSGRLLGAYGKDRPRADVLDLLDSSSHALVDLAVLNPEC